MPSTNPPATLHLDQASFDATLRATSQPILVDFWAAWCPPCRAIAPTIDRLADATKGSAVVAKVDVDAAAEIAGRYQVRAIPTLIIFKDGKEVDRLVGVHDEQTLRDRLNAAA